MHAIIETMCWVRDVLSGLQVLAALAKQHIYSQGYELELKTVAHPA